MPLGIGAGGDRRPDQIHRSPRARHRCAGGWEALLIQAAAERADQRDQGVRCAAPSTPPRYLADETYRRRISRQLNKGENLHTLRRSLAYASEGAIRRRHHEQQTEQMWCLTVATNAIVCWSTEYHGLGVAALRQAGRDVDDEVLAHIWPDPPRERALLRHPLRRHRRGTRPARHRRLSAAS